MCCSRRRREPKVGKMSRKSRIVVVLASLGLVPATAVASGLRGKSPAERLWRPRRGRTGRHRLHLDRWLRRRSRVGRLVGFEWIERFQLVGGPSRPVTVRRSGATSAVTGGSSAGQKPGGGSGDNGHGIPMEVVTAPPQRPAPPMRPAPRLLMPELAIRGLRSMHSSIRPGCAPLPTTRRRWGSPALICSCSWPR